MNTVFLIETMIVKSNLETHNMKWSKHKSDQHTKIEREKTYLCCTELGRGWGCLVLQILTLFQTKTCNFPHPFSDQTSKIHTRFQTWPLARNYVIIT